MSRISIESIREELAQIGWDLISKEYKNLDSELIFQCNEGHQVYSTWKKIRSKAVCPICEENQYKKDLQVTKKKKGEYRILALDQATHNTGYALFSGTKLIKFGVFEAQGKSEEARCNSVKNWLLQKINDWGLDFVGIEGIQLQKNITMGVTTFQTLARLQGILIDLCYENKIPFDICPPATWRNHCGVKGKTRNEKKMSMKNLAKQWYDITINDDIADAIGLGRYFVDNFIPTVEIVEWE